MTYADMIACLRAGGIDPNALDRGRKNLRDLYDEIRGCDVTLTLAEINGQPRALRTALSVKGLITSDWGYLCETAREFSNNGERVEDFKAPGLSGTRKRTELPTRAAVAEFWEEYRLRVRTKQIQFASGPEVESIRDSSVYSDGQVAVVSRTLTQYFAYRRKRPFGERQIIVRDGGVNIFHEWRTFTGMSVEQCEKIAKIERILKAGKRGPMQSLYYRNSDIELPNEPFEHPLLTGQ